ncbi:MAG TPA: 7TM diverse intracellular signaling domain-containing protein, partial [Devosia sp.]|nr:7TM diverse intracellular signaling domain-containing protein [Devosia sp.]
MPRANSATVPDRQAALTARIERRSIVVLLLVMAPLLVALVYWLNLPTGQRIDLGGQAQAYVDPTGTLGLSDILAQADLFPPATGNAANLGVRTNPQSEFWLRLPMDAVRALLPPDATAPYVLSMEEPRFRQVTLYRVGPDAAVVEQRFMRDAQTGYRFPVFVLPAEALQADAHYARIVTASSMRATLYLAPEPQFAASYTRTTIGLALLLGMMVAAAAYLVPLGVVLRRGIYLSLGAAMLFAGLYVASDQALLETYLLPGAIVLSRGVSLSATVLLYGAFLSFSVRFLHLGRHARRLRRVVDAVAALILLVGVAALLDGLLDAGVLRRFLPYIGMVAGVSFAGLLVLGTIQAPRRALLFAIMWLPLLVTGLMRVQLDTAPGQAASAVALNGVYFGLALSLLLFSVVTPLELYRRELRLRQRAQALLERLESFAGIGRDIYFEIDATGAVVYLAGDGAVVGGLPARAQEALSAATAAARPLRNHIFAAGEAEAQRWYSLSGAPADNAAHFRAILRDVTAEIEQENQRQQEQQLISLGSLAATVAHEINNVVQPIVNMSKGLREHVGAVPTAGRMLDLIDLAAQQAVVLVGRILKVGARSSELASTGREIDLAVQDAIETLRLILPTSLMLETSIDTVPGVIVRP